MVMSPELKARMYPWPVIALTYVKKCEPDGTYDHSVLPVKSNPLVDFVPLGSLYPVAIYASMLLT